MKYQLRPKNEQLLSEFTITRRRANVFICFAVQNELFEFYFGLAFDLLFDYAKKVIFRLIFFNSSRISSEIKRSKLHRIFKKYPRTITS